MAANDVFYKKYGGFGTPDMAALTSGQAAVDNSVNGVFQGVKDLLQQTEDIYKENNTLNMQEYLKSKLRADGLGADPLDKEAIKKNFGNMIHMDQVTDTFANEKQQMETEAVDAAAAQAFAATEDPLQVRQLFEQNLRGAGAKESLVSSATQALSDANALRFQDYELEQQQEANSRTNSLFQEITQKGREVAPQAIEFMIKDLPEDKQAEERRRLYKEFDQESQLTEEQRANVQHYTELETTLQNQKIQVKQNKLAELEAQHAALQRTGIQDEAYSKASETFGLDLGMSTPQAIGDKVTNWIENFSGSSDRKVVTNLYRAELARGVDSKDAGAALVQAFSEYYPGDRLFGNDLPSETMPAFEKRVQELGDNAKNRYALTGTITKMRGDISSTELKAQEQIQRTRQLLLDAGRDTRLRVDGAFTIDDAYAKLLGQRKQPATPVNQDKGTAVLAGVDISAHASDAGIADGTGIPHEEKVRNLYAQMPQITSADTADAYIRQVAPESPITGEMIDKYAKQYDLDPKLLLSMLQQDSSLGTKGKAIRTKNPGNVGNDDTGALQFFDSWEEGVEAEAKWLAKHKVTGKAKATTDAPIKLTSEAVRKRAEKNAKRKPTGSSGSWDAPAKQTYLGHAYGQHAYSLRKKLYGSK